MGGGKAKMKEKVYYPTLYISGVKGLDMSVGDIEFHAKGRVISVSERETMKDGQPSEDYSVEIEVREMVPMGMEEMEGEGLDSALDSIASKKSKKMEMEVEDEEGEMEDEEESY
jgi:hypothetical protein